MKEYDGTCMETHCDTDDIQVNSAYEIIASFGKAIYNSIVNFKSGLINVKQALDDPSIIVWKFWGTILDTLEKYLPPILSLIFFLLAAVINVLMWYIRVPLLHILQSDAILLLVYSLVGPKLVIEYFPSFLSKGYRVFYVLIIEYPFYTAVAFLLLSFHNFWVWIPTKVMKDTWITQKIAGLVTGMLPIPVIKIFRFFTKRSKTEQLLLDILEEQCTLKENQTKILKHLQVLEEKFK